MEWVKSGGNHNYATYTLLESGVPILLLRYNERQKMGRIVYSGERRVFKLEQSSFFPGIEWFYKTNMALQ
jgi:hypothetical protein